VRFHDTEYAVYGDTTGEFDDAEIFIE